MIAGTVNALNKNAGFRGVLESAMGVHKNARVPEYHSKTLRKRLSPSSGDNAEPAGPTTGKVALPERQLF